MGIVVSIEWDGCKLSSLNKSLRASRFKKSGAASSQRQGALLRVANALYKYALIKAVYKPFRVKITRQGPRRLDDDNLAGSCKHIRDGVADALGVNDGDTKAVQFSYDQVIAQTYACRIEVACGVEAI